MPQRILTIVVVLLALGAGRADARPLPVVAVRGLTLADLPALARHGAVGLLVANAGPTTSAALALAGIERGVLHNARLGPRPDGPVLVRVRVARSLPRVRRAIVVGLPPGRAEPNDRRFPVAVLGGCRGILVSARTRVPGLVSAADLAPTARGRGYPLRCRSGGAGALGRLEARVATARATTFPTLLVVLFAVLALAAVAPASALAGLEGALAANLLLGLVPLGGASLRVVLVALAILAGAAARRPLGLALVAAYAVAMAVEPAALALAPLSPELTARFYGVSNVLETLLLAPVLAGTAAVALRFGPLAFAGAAAFCVAAVAENRLGDDAGGAAVLAVAFAVLGLRLGRRAFVTAAAAGTVTAVAIVVLDTLVSGPDHLRGALGGGIGGLVAVAAHRVPLAYARAASQWYLVLPLTAGTLLVRATGSAVARAVAGGIAVSLLVNDSPEAVVLGGLAALVAVDARRVHAALAPLVPRPLAVARARP